MVHYGTMPELPEVESIRRQLDAVLVGRRLVDLTASWPKTLVARGTTLTAAHGLAIDGVDRRGKVLILGLDGHLALLVHLRMTGQLLLDETGELEGPKTRCVITMDRGALVFNDQRKFGRLVLMPASLVAEDPLLARMGPEPLETSFSAQILSAHLRRHRSISVKAALLDQSTVAGIGNIYADEILFASEVNPARRCDQLTRSDIERLATAIVAVLSRAINAGGSTMRDYRDANGAQGSYLEEAAVFARTGQPCRRCSASIIKVRVAGRGTHLCPSCQSR